MEQSQQAVYPQRNVPLYNRTQNVSLGDKRTSPIGAQYKKFVSGSQYKFFKDRHMNDTQISETTHIGVGSPSYEKGQKGSINFTDD